MPEKQCQNVVKHGDSTQRVGVEVIRARGVDLEKLIKMLVANAAAEFAGARTRRHPQLDRDLRPDVWQGPAYL
jgi:hypothetical protein